MNAATIIREVISDGLHLSLTEQGSIELTGDKSSFAKWAPIIKLHKPEIIAALAANDAPLAPDLEHLIARAGAFWEYSPDDYSLINEVARRDPEGLRLALESDAWMMAKREAFEERAAILEFDAGHTREEAEHLARQATP